MTTKSEVYTSLEKHILGSKYKQKICLIGKGGVHRPISHGYDQLPTSLYHVYTYCELSDIQDGKNGPDNWENCLDMMIVLMWI